MTSGRSTVRAAPGLNDVAAARLAIRTLPFDCNDVSVQAEFWARALDGTIVAIDDEGAIFSVTSRGPRFCSSKVSEPKTAKNRIHSS